ncbi:phosphoadenylyl-sulfate reductase [Klebsiella grimontii]|uniref:Phosphoadenylyl-sulfate reductase n=1 Tax=Klebsiella grimontii TaxID=2058152 RepID=A0A7H4NXW3_9ENTR|nr:phosphoadenylyl-sulfate reductase [Klebsiella grimontii]
MSILDLNALNALPKVDRVLRLAETNSQLEKLSAEARVAWALENLPANTCSPRALVSRRR